MNSKRCTEVSTSIKDPYLSVRTGTLYVQKNSINRKSSSDSDQATAYSIWDLRRSLRTALDKHHELTLQLWSKLHPDESARATRPIADIEAYVNYLTRVARSGQFRSPPKVALERRNEARKKRRIAWVMRQAEARKQARHDADLANEVRQLQASKGAIFATPDTQVR